MVGGDEGTCVVRHGNRSAVRSEGGTVVVGGLGCVALAHGLERFELVIRRVIRDDRGWLEVGAKPARRIRFRRSQLLMKIVVTHGA